MPDIERENAVLLTVARARSRFISPTSVHCFSGVGECAASDSPDGLFSADGCLMPVEITEIYGVEDMRHKDAKAGKLKKMLGAIIVKCPRQVVSIHVDASFLMAPEKDVVDELVNRVIMLPVTEHLTEAITIARWRFRVSKSDWIKPAVYLHVSGEPNLESRIREVVRVKVLKMAGFRQENCILILDQWDKQTISALDIAEAWRSRCGDVDLGPFAEVWIADAPMAAPVFCEGWRYGGLRSDFERFKDRLLRGFDRG